MGGKWYKMIKKFKNGNVSLSWNKEESTIEQLYDGGFFGMIYILIK